MALFGFFLLTSCDDMGTITSENDYTVHGTLTVMGQTMPARLLYAEKLATYSLVVDPNDYTNTETDSSKPYDTSYAWSDYQLLFSRGANGKIYYTGTTETVKPAALLSMLAKGTQTPYTVTSDLDGDGINDPYSSADLLFAFDEERNQTNVADGRPAASTLNFTNVSVPKNGGTLKLLYRPKLKYGVEGKDLYSLYEQQTWMTFTWTAQ